MALEPPKPLFDEGYNMYSVMMVVGTVPESGEGVSMTPEPKVAKTMSHTGTNAVQTIAIKPRQRQGQQQSGDAAGSVE
ncbi:hypothetical protein HCU01_30320 [Halomonas cupida]|uniref:Uncharacterized protein n=2 Tax=Halomonas cupida TaxID=44933 RepID=A0ABQ0WI63_9GAMM|nr:hypothetical protein HCU01_30320 [Halomonas cupida]